MRGPGDDLGLGGVRLRGVRRVTPGLVRGAGHRWGRRGLGWPEAGIFVELRAALRQQRLLEIEAAGVGPLVVSKPFAVNFIDEQLGALENIQGCRRDRTALDGLRELSLGAPQVVITGPRFAYAPCVFCSPFAVVGGAFAGVVKLLIGRQSTLEACKGEAGSGPERALNVTRLRCKLGTAADLAVSIAGLGLVNGIGASGLRLVCVRLRTVGVRHLFHEEVESIWNFIFNADNAVLQTVSALCAPQARIPQVWEAVLAA